ncbi:hypothetical protein GCM10022405_44140 [Gibbsiella dentisursi]|uniref:Lipoprotein n=1 Tax=Gibbsiella dentisursi TaxID=796890 RepID=A0ABP7M747_9GAMM
MNHAEARQYKTLASLCAKTTLDCVLSLRVNAAAIAGFAAVCCLFAGSTINGRAQSENPLSNEQAPGKRSRKGA